MRNFVFLLAIFALLFSSCKKEYIEPYGNGVDTVYVNGGNNNNNNNPPTGWHYAATTPTMTGNEFAWNLSNSSLDPTGKEIFVVWISNSGAINYNKLLDGVSGVFSGGSINSGTIRMTLSPSYGKLKFNFAVNSGPPSNKWFWFIAQGPLVQLPCQHTSGGLCFDDGVNNLFSTLYSGGNWVAGDPCP